MNVLTELECGQIIGIVLSVFFFFFFNLYYLFFILIFLEIYLIRVWQVLSIFNEQSSELIFLASLIKFEKKKSGLLCC